MITWLLTFVVRWFHLPGARVAIVRAIAAAGDLAVRDAARALRQRFPLTASRLDVWQRNSGLRRRPGESDRDLRLRLGAAGSEVERQGQAGYTRQLFAAVLADGWRIEDFPHESFIIGDQIGVPATQRRIMGPGPTLIVHGATETAIVNVIETLDPDIEVVVR